MNGSEIHKSSGFAKPNLCPHSITSSKHWMSVGLWVCCYFWLIPLRVCVSLFPFLFLSLGPGLVIVSFVCLSSVLWIGEGGQLWTTPALKTLRAGSRVCVCWTTLSLNGHSWGWNTVAVTHATGASVSQKLWLTDNVEEL